MVHRLIITCFVDIWNLFFIIVIVKRFCFGNQRNAKMKMPKPVLYAALAAFSGFPICYTAKSVLYLINPEETSAVVHIKYSIVWFSFAVSRISFYIFMVLRIHYLFQHTSLALTKQSRIVHGAIIALSPAWIIIMVVLQSYDEYQMYYQYTSIGLIVVLMLGSIHVLYIFNRSLFQLLKQDKMKNIGTRRAKSVEQSQTASTISTTQSSTVSTKTRVMNRSTRDGDNGRKRKRAEANSQLLNTIVKHNFLTWVIITMFLCFVVMFGLLSFGLEWNDTQKYALWWIQCLTINTATFCIFLGFNINNSWYDVICGKCDICCGSICRFGVETQLGRYIEGNLRDEKKMEMSQSNGTNNNPMDTPISSKANVLDSPVSIDCSAIDRQETFDTSPVGKAITDLFVPTEEIVAIDTNDTLEITIDPLDTVRSNEPDPDLIATV